MTVAILDDGFDQQHEDLAANMLPGYDYEGTNGVEDVGNYYDPATHTLTQVAAFGVDDAGERETVPPYDKPLRGVQIIIRAYERDSRAIRQVRVTQHFMPE